MNMILVGLGFACWILGIQVTQKVVTLPNGFFHGDESPTVGFVPTKITNKNTSKETGILLKTNMTIEQPTIWTQGISKWPCLKHTNLWLFRGFFVTCHFGEWNSVTNFKKLEEVNSPMKKLRSTLPETNIALVGGFNPPEKYWSKWNPPQVGMEEQNMFESTT